MTTAPTHAEARRQIERIARKHTRELKVDNYRNSLEIHVYAWADPAHALLEILQNSDDAEPAGGRESVSIEFRFEREGMAVEHDGNIFSPKDVWGISGIGNSSKSAEKHIGFMGIGFKSVYRFAAAAYIKSGPFSFCFRPENYPGAGYGWITVPAWCDKLPLPHKPDEKTLLFFPYSPRLSQDTKSRLQRVLTNDFPAVCLMFLRHISQISVIADGQTARVLSKNGDTITDVRDGIETVTSFWEFRKRFTVPDKCKDDDRVRQSHRHLVSTREIAVVFERDGEGGLTKTLTPSSLFAFLPTDQRTRLPFAVQCDFILDAQRLLIDQSIEWNRWLLQSAGKVLMDAVRRFKQHGTTKYSFSQVMPDPGVEAEEFIKATLLEPFWEQCRGSKIVPSRNGKWLVPTEAAFASKEMQELVDSERLEQLTERHGYVDSRVQPTAFLEHIGVIAFEDERIVEALEDQAWLRAKPPTWFKRLYRFLDSCFFEGPRRRDIVWPYRPRLVEMSIIPTADGDIASPNEALFPPANRKARERVLVLPTLKLVHPTLGRGEVHEFLQKLGVQDYGQEEAIRKCLLPGIEAEKWKKWTVRQRHDVLQFLAEWLRSIHWEPPADLVDTLPAVPLKADDGKWYPARYLYARTPALERLLGKQRWVSHEIETEGQGWEKFIEILGVTTCVRVEQKDDEYRYTGPTEGLPRWQEYFYSVIDWTGRSHRIGDVAWLPLLDQVLGKARNLALARMIADKWDSYYSRYRRSCHRYEYHGSKNKPVDSYFFWQLRKTAWLPTTAGIMEASTKIVVPNKGTKRAFGDLAYYLKLPQASLKNGTQLWDLLDLSSRITPESVASVMKALPGKWTGAQMQRQLGLFYRSVGRLLARQIEEKGESSAAEWKRQLADVPLLSGSCQFVKSVNEAVLWADSGYIARLFEDELAFVWYPPDVEKPILSLFFKCCGVLKFSDALQTELHYSTGQAAKIDRNTTQCIHDRANLLYCCVAHRSPTLADEVRRLFRSIRVLRAERVEVIWKACDSQRSGSASAFLDRDAAKLHLEPGCQEFDIALELCRAWGIDKEFAPTLEYALTAEQDRVAERLRQLGIAVLSFDGVPHDRLRKDDSLGKDTAPAVVGHGTAEGISPDSHDVEWAAEARRPVQAFRIRDLTPGQREVRSFEQTENGWRPGFPKDEDEGEELPSLDAVDITFDNSVPTGPARKKSRRMFVGIDSLERATNQTPTQRRYPEFAGHRAEEIVDRSERERLERLGHDPDDHLLWVSQQQPNADHDFESVDEHGNKIYIEVKSTVDGSFHWSGNEIALAMEKRQQYELYLVFNATTLSPVVKPYRDPIGLYENGQIELQIESVLGTAPTPPDL